MATTNEVFIPANLCNDSKFNSHLCTYSTLSFNPLLPIT